MKYGSLVLEESEFIAIKNHLENNLSIEDYAHKNALELLAQNMGIAMVLNTADIPFDIVTINSTIKVTGASGVHQTFTIVPPEQSNAKQHKVSVISSLGASVIGRAVGDRISFGLPGEMMSLVIEKVIQPNQANKITPKVSTI
ncbi:MAG: GreA/GreB family elongation factor [Maribacter dokdonensis]|jgi:regulator of nucleoside diphosphate kinase|uniref:Regulator of nucleoside diphosphate kinase n=1 Tax=Maribacter dokdonensis TaxID=320912 RepID=A0A1H4PU29_9FLAO|nr:MULTISPECIES: GreA/GreB family elongation factor [Maribacter]HAF78377.1 hypothetical protein [Maribacter sp.]MBU2899568.1 GreA/GreB family elongation factor [Maribacter dokdonensis]MDP2526854.1 GreA/GreB family elongation factor [Maribacter dokdonensis]CAG2532382.1 regulator of nucleoside diphosphate kinase [Maribacter dokdonensis]SDS81495.1 regulator of nucleoside diphosphate kinase [Maribacter dokdonensis]|tara:strand:- start:3305 stop:3733 length:429 start_codon:yes stop_codon:yes gene_type:complete